jgi:hypothetical protein
MSRVRALAHRPLIPGIVDVTHATKESAAFFRSFFTAKSRHDVDATMNHFSTSTLTYIDATLGWSFIDAGSIVRLTIRQVTAEEVEADIVTMAKVDPELKGPRSNSARHERGRQRAFGMNAF